MRFSPQSLIKYKFVVAIIGSIIIALVLTVISVSLYIRSGVASLDLSRPGYEQARQQITTKDTPNTFLTTGPVDAQALKEFRELYQTQLQQLQASSDFGDQTLEDAQLRFTADPQAPPASQ